MTALPGVAAFSAKADRPGRGRRGKFVLTLVLSAATAIFIALGVWQIERRAWKLALIDRVEQRVTATPIEAPGPSGWPGITAQSAEYMHVLAAGRFLSGRDTYVRASTELGAGYWVLSPMLTEQGFIVLVNRGFVPSLAQANESTPPRERVTATGLLRMSEPGGGFLRANDPANNRWYSRDVAAIAAARGLTGFAPYFIDAAAGANADAWPRGGLTVIRFRNEHMAYALTWIGLAIGALVGIVLIWCCEPDDGLASRIADN